MIYVEELSMAYHGDPLFEKATFTIQDGERCGLVGRNGSGKSTLFRIITGKEKPHSGKIILSKGYKLGILDQHIHFTKPTLLEEAALGLPKGEEENIYKAEKILFGLGFKEEDMDKATSDFSGGYQLRLHLAKVLISEPDCLLLDEPTNYLDIVSIRWFARFLKQWKGEFILISHDREFMDSVCTHTMGIHRQKVQKFPGNTIAFYSQIFEQEEIHEKTRQTLEKKREHAQGFIERFGAKATKAAQAQSRQKMIEKIPVLEKLKGINSLDFRFHEAPFFGKNMFEATNVSFSYTPDANPPLIENLSLAVEKGERIAIIGKNGRGKSTILRLLAKELTPNSGTIKHSENVRIGYFGQTNIDRLHPKHTIEEEISLSNPKLNRTQVKAICGVMMFSSEKAEKVTSVLSGGEKSRVLLGKILASPCNLLLLDEPTHHLDMESIETLIDALEEFQGSVILVTHSEQILKRMNLNKIVICHQGRQDVFLGGYEEFLEKLGWEEEADTKKNKKKASSPADNKRLRAELIMERSKELKPLDLEISQTEAQITKLEIEQQQAQKQVIEIAKGQESKETQELYKAIGVRQNTIDQLYKSLDQLTKQRDRCYNDFERKLESL